MKNLSVEKTHKIIELAKLAYPRHSPGSKTVNLVEVLKRELTDVVDDENTAFETLYKYIDELSNEERADLIALMWLGRGAGGEEPKYFSEIVEQAKIHSSEYVASKAPLAQYLEDGLEKLNNYTSDN